LVGGRPGAMWWAEGVRFGCTACGRCCARRLPPATGPLAEAEIAGMAAALGLPSAASFRQRFTEPLPGGAVGQRRLRAEPGSGRCPLLDHDGRCSVYEARPAACRTYPFWPENLASPYEWAREASLCEGIGSSWGGEAGGHTQPGASPAAVPAALAAEPPLAQPWRPNCCWRNCARQARWRRRAGRTGRLLSTLQPCARQARTSRQSLDHHLGGCCCTGMAWSCWRRPGRAARMAAKAG